MCRDILLGLFIIIGVIFVFGTLGCMFWLGLATLELFLKIIMPILLVVVIVGIIAFLVDFI